MISRVDINILKNLWGATKFGNQHFRLLSSLFANIMNRGVWPSFMIRCCCIEVHLVYKWYFACVSRKIVSAKIADQGSGLLVFPSPTLEIYMAWIQQVLVLGELIEIENQFQWVERWSQQTISKKLNAIYKDFEARSHWFGSRHNTH